MLARFFSRPSREPDSEEYRSVQAEIARVEGMIATLEELRDGEAEDDLVLPNGRFSVSRLRADLAREQLVSERQELERLRARAAELRGEGPRQARPSAEWIAFSARKLLVGTLAAVIVALAIGGLRWLSDPTTAQPASSISRSGPAASPAPALTATPRQATATPSSVLPSPTASPVPTTILPADDALYAADWAGGLSGWPSTDGWSASDQLLLNDGSDFGDDNWVGDLWNSHWVAAPYAPDAELTDYAVEAEIRILDRPACGSFGLVVRGGYQAGAHLCSQYGEPIAAIRSRTPELLDVGSFDPGAGWHTYRLEVRGTLLQLLVDGVVVADENDDAFLSAGRVGLWDDHTPLAVRQFRVLDLD